jgi:cation diffusion facilitator family transporter
MSLSALQRSLLRYVALSLGAAVLNLGLKLVAWRLTGSVGLLSDALETVTNVGGAIMALLMLRLAAQPPDDDHAYGHSKAEYFSSGFEGMLIFLAAAVIVVEAVPRLWAPRPLQQPDVGLAVAAAAAALNWLVATVLNRIGTQHGSITLQADARHLMADVWTTLGVIVGVGLVAATGWLWLDPLVALAVAGNVLWVGFKLLKESATGLMDTAWPEQDRITLQQVLDEFRGQGADFHALRTRRSAARRFVDFHVLVPGDWTVQRGHDLLERIERRIDERLPNVTVLTHLEPAEDPVSYGDDGLDRV